MSEQETSSKRPRLFYGWVMVAVAFVTFAVSAGGLAYSYSVVTVIINEEFQVSQFQLMLPMTLMTLLGAFISPFLGPKVDKYPIKWFMATGAVSLSLGLLLISLAPAMGYVTVIYALLMAPVHALLGTLCSSVLISRWFSRRLSLAMGVASIGVSVGGFVLPPLINHLCNLLGWREALQVLSLASLCLLLPLVSLVVDRPALKGLQVDGAKAPPIVSKAAAAGVFNSTSSLLGNRNFWLLSITIGTMFGSYTALLTNLLPIVMEQGLAREQGAMLVATISAVGIAGKIAYGFIAGRLDLRVGLAITIVLVILGVSIYMLGRSPSHFFIGSVVLGLAVGNMLPVWGALIASLFGVANYGRAMGLMGPINVVFNLVAVPSTGLLFDLTGSYTLPLSLFIALLALSLAWIPLIKNTEG